jgi:hypothetical protein
VFVGPAGLVEFDFVIDVMSFVSSTQMPARTSEGLVMYCWFPALSVW